MRPQESARAWARRRVRRETAAEVEEGGGELTLVPYLDILVNTLVFLLATATSALPLAQIGVDAPRQTPLDRRVVDRRGSTPESALALTVAIGARGFIVAGRGGVLRAGDGTLPTIRCLRPLQHGRCPATAADGYDYPSLRRMASEIKQRYSSDRQVNLLADEGIPYRVVVRTMDALRGRASPRCSGSDGCLFDRVRLATGID